MVMGTCLSITFVCTLPLFLLLVRSDCQENNLRCVTLLGVSTFENPVVTMRTSIQKLYVLPVECGNMLCMDPTINFDYFPK